MEKYKHPSAVCQQVLPGPEAALKAFIGANKKAKQHAETLLQGAVADALHLLNLLKSILQLLSGDSYSLPISLHMALSLLKFQEGLCEGVLCNDL